ncbi:MAG: FAD-dependent oxidoreductase [Candidatus Helarchaeota archaeon]
MIDSKEITVNEKVGAVLISGGGISGIQASLDLAELGFKVYLVEKKPSIGGIMSQLDKTFPTNDCSICILAPKMLEAASHPNIELWTYTDIQDIEGEPGHFKVKVLKKARYINEDSCRNCGDCAQNCPVQVPNVFDANIGLRGAVYIPSPQAVPSIHLIDKESCLYLNHGICRICEKICKAEAINFDQKDQIITLEVGAIIFTSGAQVYNPSNLQTYGYDRYQNVITSLEFERILSASGPFGGHVLRLSDKKIPKNVAWIQCVGSRNRRINRPFCSSFCCMYAVKESIITKEHFPEIDCNIFYMDMRTPGRGFEEFYNRAKEEYGVKFIPARVSYIEEDYITKNLILNYEDPDAGVSSQKEFDLVVLSVGFDQSPENIQLYKKFGFNLNEFKTINTNQLTPLESNIEGIYVSGSCKGPIDIPQSVAEASGAAAKASALLADVRNENITEKVLPPELDVLGQQPRVGVFVCHCGINIGGVVDVPKVVDTIKTYPGVKYAEENLYTCSQDTQDRIKKAIEEYKLNRIVVASCTPRTHEKLFQNTIREAGLNPYLFEFANIREHCSWVHMHEPEEATLKAIDIVKMVIEKSKYLQPAPKLLIDVTSSALVIGGGISGLSASISLAKQGFEVHLVEKNSILGGMVNDIFSVLGDEHPQEIVQNLIDQVKKEDKISVYLNTIVEDIKGYVGNFYVTLKNQQKIDQVEVGAIIVATGAKESKPEEYLYGDDPRIVTQLELEKLIEKSKINAKNITMIQCVGSRDEKRPYCSKICCSVAIKNAIHLKKNYPDIEVNILYRDIRVTGYNELYYEEARNLGVGFIRYYPDKKPVVNIDGNKLKLKVFDQRLGSEIQINPDLLVLSAAFISGENEELAKKLKVPLDAYGFFLEAHVKLRPLDFATDGIFLCGTASWPKFITECIVQAHGAAARAGTILSKSKIEVEGSVSFVNPEICIGCGSCIEVCPYGAITMEVTTNNLEEITVKIKKAYINPAQCKGCGTCVAKCPVRAITQRHFTNKQIIKMENSIII